MEHKNIVKKHQPGQDFTPLPQLWLPHSSGSKRYILISYLCQVYTVFKMNDTSSYKYYLYFIFQDIIKLCVLHTVYTL